MNEEEEIRGKRREPVFSEVAINLHSPPCNGSDTLIRKEKTAMLYKIMIVFFSIFIVLLFICDKFGSESTQHLSVTLITFVFFFPIKFFVFILIHK